jgi:hypothetical protein
MDIRPPDDAPRSKNSGHIVIAYGFQRYDSGAPYADESQTSNE